MTNGIPARVQSEGWFIRDDGVAALAGLPCPTDVVVSLLAEGPGLGGWIAQELAGLLMLIVAAIVITLLAGAIWLTFKGANDEVVIFEDWGDFLCSFGSVIVTGMGGGAVVGSFEQGFSLVMLILGLCLGGFGLLLGWSSFERAFEHNGRGAFGIAVGCFKVVAGLLIVLVLFENWKKMTAKDSTTGDRIQAGVTIAATGWLTYALVNGERVLAKRAAGAATAHGAAASDERAAKVSKDVPNIGGDDAIPLADAIDETGRAAANPAPLAALAPHVPLDASGRSAEDRKPMTQIGAHKVRESSRRVVIRTDADAGGAPEARTAQVNPSGAPGGSSADVTVSQIPSPIQSPSPSPSPSPSSREAATVSPAAPSFKDPDRASEPRAETSSTPGSSPGSSPRTSPGVSPGGSPRMLPPRVVDRVVHSYHIEFEDGSRFGPFTIAELRELAADGRLDGDDRLKSTDGSVRIAREIPGLFEA